LPDLHIGRVALRARARAILPGARDLRAGDVIEDAGHVVYWRPTNQIASAAAADAIAVPLQGPPPPPPPHITQFCLSRDHGAARRNADNLSASAAAAAPLFSSRLLLIIKVAAFVCVSATLRHHLYDTTVPIGQPCIVWSPISRFSAWLYRTGAFNHYITAPSSVHEAAKLVAALLMVARVTAGLAESNGSLPPGL